MSEISEEAVEVVARAAQAVGDTPEWDVLPAAAQAVEYARANAALQAARPIIEREAREREGFTEWELGAIRTYASRQLDALSKPELESVVGERWLNFLNRAARLANRLTSAALDEEAEGGEEMLSDTEAELHVEDSSGWTPDKEADHA